MAQAGWMLCLASITLGVIGIVIVQTALTNLQKDLDKIGTEQVTTP